MKMNRLRLPTLVLGLLGFAAAGVACSASDTGDVPGGTGGKPPSGSAGSGVTGGTPGIAGQAPTGGSVSSSAGAGPGPGTGGISSTAGSSSGGSGTGGSGTGGSGKGGTGAGGASGKGGASSGGATGKAGSSSTGGSGGQGLSGTCTSSKATGKTVSGTGPHEVVIETNSENGIKCGTIYRPADLSGTEKYPIFVWGEGGCSQDGYSNQAAMGEIASWGYFIVADGTPGSTNACAGGQDGKAFLDYLTWAIAENGKSCSAYYQKLDTTKIAADGFSCGGLMSENVSGDS
ncbi:MAG TPA: hypothetical protein VFK05_33245, partial [Polyangiaceae bacterium]|nr:hypothetical protein [Polyangiaceae bacterium]